MSMNRLPYGRGSVGVVAILSGAILSRAREQADIGGAA
jgi:hypothetical protein